MQKDLAKIMPAERYPKETQERVSALCTAIIHEAVELQRTTNWKWWKKHAEFNVEDAKEELIDIWHFVIQASLEMDIYLRMISWNYTVKRTR